MLIYFVRHGETAANREGRIQGQSLDEPLTETGIRQVESILPLLPENFDLLPNDIIDAITSNVIVNDPLKREEIYQLFRNSCLNKKHSMKALTWLSNLSVENKLEIIRNNYGDIKIIDLKGSDALLIFKISDTSRYLTNEYWEDESISEDNISDREILKSFIKKYSYHELYTLTQINHILNNLINNIVEGKEQISFINDISFVTNNGNINVSEWVTNSTNRLIRLDTLKDRITKFNILNDESDPDDLNNVPYIKFNKKEALENYNITFEKYISKLLVIPIEDKLDRGI